MSNTLITLVTLQVFTILSASIIFYAILISLLSKKTIKYRRLLWRTVSVFALSIVVALSEISFLSKYYLGLMGFGTDKSVTSLLPFFEIVREILLPSFILISFISLIIVWYKKESLIEGSKIKYILKVLVLFGWLSTSVLIFMGILLP